MSISYEKVKENQDSKYNNYVDKLYNDSIDAQPMSISLKKLDINEIFSDEDFGVDDGLIDIDNFEKSGLNIIDEKDLTQNQRDAISLATDWYRNRRKVDPVFVIGGTAGSGKAIPMDTIIPTPNGHKRFGDLKVGDYLFDRKGQPTKITAVYPQGILDNYEITFADGRKTCSSIDHLWSYLTESKKLKTKSLKEILKDYKKEYISHTQYKYSIPLNKPVLYPEKELPVDPYVLGAFIGDGNLTSPFLQFTSKDGEIVEIIAKTLKIIYKQKKDSSYHWFFRPITQDPTHKRISTKSIFGTIPEIMNKYSHNKIIPTIYLQASIEQRYRLLQGLMDTDGCIDKNGKIMYTSINLPLIKQIRELLFSLGYKATISNFNTETGSYYNLVINISNAEKYKLFHISRKKNLALSFQNQKNKISYEMIKIKDIQLIGKSDMMCIDVDNSEHLFLMNDYIVTHNCLHEDSILFYENRIDKIKNAVVGDKIYGADGKLCTITGVFPQEEQKKCFRLLFNDNTDIIADLDQLFNYSKNNINFITGTLEDIKLIKDSVYFPINKPLRFKRGKFLLSPTLIGFLLNYDCLDFEFYHEFFTIYLNESLFHSKTLISNVIDIMKTHGYILNTNNIHRGVLSFTEIDRELANNFKQVLSEMNLISFDKKRHIPIEYIYSSIRDRNILLNALLNIDTISYNDITTKVANGIENDIRLLVETLGGLIFNTENNDELTFAFSQVLTDIESTILYKKLIDVQDLDDTYNTICIKVDNKDELYISNDCIVVHNTSIIPHFVNNIDLKSTGHALPYNAKVLKRNGQVPICTLKVGDEICGGNGEFCKVKGIYPQGKREMYKVHFSDGSSTICDKEHLWTVATLNEKFGTYTLDYIMKQGLIAPTGRVKFRIPLVQPVQFSPKKLPIHPYLLGTMINGTFNRGDVMTFRTKHREILPRIHELLARHNFKLSDPITHTDTGMEECYILSKTETIANNWLNDRLHELGLRNLELHEKFIPPIYLFGSPEQRRQLLNGLIDAFGTFNHKSNTTELKPGNKHAFTVEFTSKSLQLLKDIQFLVESLGGITDLHEVSAAYHKISKDESINTFENWYKMSIKVRTFGMRIVNTEFTERCNINKVLLQRTIKKIENLNEEMEAICIEVDEPHGLFITNNFIVTHNTTVNSKIAYATFTGRAAMVLQRKGIPATTIHKLIYDYKVEKDKRGVVKKAYFEKKPMLPPRLKLIVIDEFSMVSTEMMKDLMSYGIPIVMFGDPCQLPPVGGNLNPYLNKFNIMLTEVHRQAADNPILTLATNIRNGNLGLKYGDYGKLKIVPKAQLDKDTMFSADQVICGTNKSRQDINGSFRRHLGRRSLLPESGDKVICLKNNWEVPPIDDFYLVNGMVGYISDLGMDGNGRPIFDFTPDFLDRSFWKIRYEPKIFLGEEVKPAKWAAFGMANQFDYGYAITCHKSQGGEFENVIVWEEVLRREQHAQWLYTAATRASETLIIYH